VAARTAVVRVVRSLEFGITDLAVVLHDALVTVVCTHNTSVFEGKADGIATIVTQHRRRRSSKRFKKAVLV
jgi:hypothetical protein